MCIIKNRNVSGFYDQIRQLKKECDPGDGVEGDHLQDSTERQTDFQNEREVKDAGDT